LGHAALEGQEDEVGAAANAEFVEEIGDVELDGALGDIELAGDLFVGEIFKERIEDFLFAAAEIGDGIGFEAAALAGEDRVYETREKLARNPEAATGDQRKSANELVAGFDIGEKTLNAEAKERVAVGFVVLVADDDEARVGIAFENIGEECAGSGFGGVGVHDVDLRAGRLEVAEIGRQSGFELLGDHLEIGLG
jgi:hypothetical protein